MAPNQQPLCWKRTVASSRDSHKSHDRFKTAEQHFHYKYRNVSRILKNIQVLSKTFSPLFKGTSVETWFPTAQRSSRFHWFYFRTIEFLGIEDRIKCSQSVAQSSDVIKNALGSFCDRRKNEGISQVNKNPTGVALLKQFCCYGIRKL